MAEQRITKADLQAQFQAVQDGMQGKVESKKKPLAAAGIGLGVLLVLLVYLLGRRSGKARTTLVEVRRL